jgi:hypothetical protein
MSSSSSLCSNPGCNKEGNSKCAACSQVAYCGQTCQKTHWPNHKKACKAHRKQQQKSAEAIFIEKADPYSWRGCKYLVSVVLSSKVKNIGEGAFCDCAGLISVVIPNSVKSIGQGAFSGCTGLTSVVIPDSIASIGVAAFYECKQLESVVIPDSVTSIGVNGAVFQMSCTACAVMTHWMEALVPIKCSAAAAMIHIGSTT